MLNSLIKLTNLIGDFQDAELLLETFEMKLK